MPSSGYSGTTYTRCTAAQAGKHPYMKIVGLMILSKCIDDYQRRACLIAVISLWLERQALPLNFETVFYNVLLDHSCDLASRLCDIINW